MIKIFREQINSSSENYEKNLEKYLLYDPLTALKLSQYDFTDYDYCYSHLGELNLLRKVGDHTVFYHDMEGAYEEAKKWYQNKEFKNHRILFIFGLGLGYYYEFIKIWLKENPLNRLIFLEDELGVIEYFLGTNLATELLDDPQVIIHYLDIYPTNSPQMSIHLSINHLLKGYIRYNSFLGSTKLYTQRKENICLLIRDVIFYISSWYLVVASEILSKQSGVVTNHYHNMLRQFQASNGHHLKNRFKGVPAIICGAGPSIVNDIEELKKIHNEAVIIGSGTGMNVLNHYGVTAHFGTGLDPTDSQGTRIRTNYAYEVPVFYRPRFHAKSFDLLQGPKLYLQGTLSSDVGTWFDNELGIEQEELLNPGISSTNFSMQIARLLGCNPIILLGIDLAYTDASRYPPIISAHPTDSRKDKEEITNQSEVPVHGTSNSGNQVITKIEWFEESKTIRAFKSVSPDIQLISCSKDGLSVQGVDFIPFTEVREKYLTKTWDLVNKIHAETVKAYPCVDREASLIKMEEWNGSIKKCCDNFHEIEKNIKKTWDTCLEGERLNPAPYNGKIALLEAEIWEEPAFESRISDLINIVDDMALDKKTELRCYSYEKTDTEKDLLKLEIDLNYLVFFQSHLEYHNSHLKELIEDFVEEEKELSTDHHKGIKQASEVFLDEECYSTKNGFLIIQDEEMGIDIRVPFTPQMIPEESISQKDDEFFITDVFLEYEGKIDGQYLQLNKDLFVESELFYHQGKLHGPSTFFHKNGVILARSWYIEGKKEGKTWQRYPSGSLYSLQRYRDGIWDGLQEYYYENGYLKSSLRYAEGRFDGDVKLYYKNGRLKRELHFVEGQLDGVERYYSCYGKLIWEANYSEGTPIEHARVWHSNGQLAREYTYSDDHQQYVLKEWDKMGNLIAKQVNLLENLQQINEKRQKNLIEAIGKFNKDMLHMQYLTKHEKKQFIY
jgi:antitoxin component YwqK of YwqJK toxin-antitoxin module